MSGKSIVFILLLSFTLAHGEVIHSSKLNREKKSHGWKRDLFSPQTKGVDKVPDNRQSSPAAQSPSSLSEAELKREVRTSVSYDGYVIKQQRRHALLNVNGEFFVAGEGEEVAEILKVIKIEKDKVHLEVEGKVIEIPLKGDGDDEI